MYDLVDRKPQTCTLVETSILAEKRIPRILLVERDQLIYRSLKGGAIHRGWALSATQWYSKALEMIAIQPPDLIITEMLLKDKPGSELIRTLQSTYSLKHIPIIVLSSFQTPCIARDVLILGARAYLVKPIRVNQVLAKISQYLSV
jgi:DNA-binding response OmpR family regulator